jgi:hypothetical protein
MNNEESAEVLQSMLQYYRTKCSQLEHEFLGYKIQTDSRIKQLESSIQEFKKEK